MEEYIKDLYYQPTIEELQSEKENENNFENLTDDSLLDEEWKRKLRKYANYLRRTFYVVVTDYLPNFILGMTDGRGKIWIQRLYGYLREKVLRHEVIHNLFPEMHEYGVRRLEESGFLRGALGNFNFIYVR